MASSTNRKKWPVTDSEYKSYPYNSPANPTGSILSPEAMHALASIGYYLVADETYHGLVYDSQEHSILEFTDKAFVLGPFQSNMPWPDGA